MNTKRSVLVSHFSSTKPITSEGLEQSKPRHMHRRTISQTSDELLASLKISSPQVKSKVQLITPETVIKHLNKKNLSILKEENPEEVCENLSDEETNIRNIIEQRKALSPIVVSNTKESPVGSSSKTPQDPIRVSFNTSTTAFTTSEETNIDRIILILETQCLPGTSNKNIRKNILDLMQKSPEPYYTLIIDDYNKLKGIYYIDISTGYFHKILGNDDLPLLVPPRKVKSFLYYDPDKGFVNSFPPRFDAIVLKS
jgi:Microtubule-binding calmodulin-regulated spectrin-associated